MIDTVQMDKYPSSKMICFIAGIALGQIPGVVNTGVITDSAWQDAVSKAESIYELIFKTLESEQRAPT